MILDPEDSRNGTTEARNGLGLTPPAGLKILDGVNSTRKRRIQLVNDRKPERGVANVPAALAPGAEITITVAPARNGKAVGTMSNIILANGDSVCGLGGGREAGNCK